MIVFHTGSCAIMFDLDCALLSIDQPTMTTIPGFLGCPASTISTDL